MGKQGRQIKRNSHFVTSPAPLMTGDGPRGSLKLTLTTLGCLVPLKRIRSFSQEVIRLSWGWGGGWGGGGEEIPSMLQVQGNIHSAFKIPAFLLSDGASKCFGPIHLAKMCLESARLFRGALLSEQPSQGQIRMYGTESSSQGLDPAHFLYNVLVDSKCNLNLKSNLW